MIRVLHVITTLDVGGAEAQVLEVVRRLDRDRFAPEIAWLKGRGELAEEFEAAGVPVHRVRSHGLGPVRETLGLMRRLRPRVVHTHLGKADVAGALASRLAKVPVVVSTKHNEDHYLKVPPVALAARAVTALADRIVVISDAVGRFLAHRLLLPRRRMTRILYGFPPDGLPVWEDPGARVKLRGEFGFASDVRIVACVARLSAQKGLFDLLRAAALLRDAVPEARFLVVGRGEQEGRLREAATRLGVSATVRFLGFRRDIDRILRGSDVLVLPSHWEGFGMVLLEAMEAGIPVVGTRVGAIPEVVADGETGLLVPPRDPDTLAAALLTTLRYPERADRMGRAGRSRLESVFTIGRAVRAHEDLYSELLSRRNGH